MSGHLSLGKRLVPLLLAPVLALLAVLALPRPALARSYEVTDVTIDATLDADGSLHVVESRTFDFDGSFNGVFWEIPQGANPGNGAEVSVSVDAAGRGDGASLDAFEESDSEEPGTYQLSESPSVLTLKIFSPEEDGSATFTISYTATGIATRWEDTSELYWKFVSDGWDVESQNVTCTLHLPVPEGESVAAGENVRAWGHGPLDAEVSFSGDDLVFRVPGVGTDEFAEMRVVFPSAWLAGLDETAGEKLPGILSEEEAWAAEADAERERARRAGYAALGAAAALAVASIAAAALFRARYRRDFRPSFDGPYFRDVPTADHPAVLAALWRGGESEPSDLTATLMRLTDEGLVRLQRVEGKGGGILKRDDGDFLIVRVPSEGAAGAPDPVDAAALALLFEKIPAEDGEGTLAFSQIEAYAKENPQEYSDAWEAWKGVVYAEYLRRFSGNGLKGYGRPVLYALFAVDALGAAVVVGAALASVLPLLWALPCALVLAAVSALCFVAARAMRDVNREGVETSARLGALRRWLCDFTRLDEAVPSDVVLWNRLLVMAVALGVADEVVKQLKFAAPELLQEEGLMPTYGWLFWYGSVHGSPARLFDQRVSAAHSVSAAALAASRNSSVGGLGGGFSGGGGGGFGGGGGGGAF